jgi:hypothetical protein
MAQMSAASYQAVTVPAPDVKALISKVSGALKDRLNWRMKQLRKDFKDLLEQDANNQQLHRIVAAIGSKLTNRSHGPQVEIRVPNQDGEMKDEDALSDVDEHSHAIQGFASSGGDGNVGIYQNGKRGRG